jgi:hypothetical protein
MSADNLTDVQRRCIEEALDLISAVQEEVGSNQTLPTYLKLGEATRKLEALLRVRGVER